LRRSPSRREPAAPKPFSGPRLCPSLHLGLHHPRPSPPPLACQVTSYRGGLTAPERRRIERQLYEGSLRAVTATSTLELGVDIAHLEAVIILGFPGSVAKLWQRAGRCGRDPSADALCVVVAYPSAIDQWVMRHPAAMLARPLEACVVDAQNPALLKQRCSWLKSVIHPA
jgi:DEAD/DEAH box helicase domain-containing protein